MPAFIRPRVTNVDVLQARIAAHRLLLLMHRGKADPQQVAAHYCAAEEVAKAFRRERRRVRSLLTADPLEAYCKSDPGALECRVYDL